MTSADYRTPSLRLLLELLALAALAWWGLHMGEGPVGRAALGAGVPLAAGALWGTFAASRRRPRPATALRRVAGLAAFAGAAVALGTVWAPVAGAVLGGAAVAAELVAASTPDSAVPPGGREPAVKPGRPLGA